MRSKGTWGVQMDSYWTRYSRSISRRRLLGAAGTAGIGLALMNLGCSTDDQTQSTGDSQHLITKPDFDSKGKRGGLYGTYVPLEPLHLDPDNIPANIAPLTYHVFQKLMSFKPHTVDNLSSGENVGDAAESWEITPDGLTVTFKLRPNMKFDPRPPTEGRTVQATDVLFSWERFVAQSPDAPELSSIRNPRSPIESMKASDNRTITVKLAYPYAPILALLGDQRFDMAIQPTEADAKYDPKKEMRGSGPFYLENWTPGVGYSFKRNPGYFDANRPYFDGIEMPVISEYAQQVAQFQARRIWALNARQEDLLSIKRENPLAVLRRNLVYFLTAPTLIYLSQLPNSPFLDVRVRRAMSMLIDRQLWIDTFENVDGFAKEGIDIETRWSTHLSLADDRFWRDPKEGKVGDGSKYFAYNPAEAAKLFQAAGIKDLDFSFNYSTKEAQPNKFAVFSQMFSAGGFLKPSLKVIPNNEFNERYHLSRGLFEGIASQGAGAATDPDFTFSARYLDGSAYSHFPGPLPTIQPLLEKQRKELDPQRRREVILQIQEEMASEMPTIPHPGLGRGLNIAWPWLRNFGSIVPWGGDPAGVDGQKGMVIPDYWYDESLKT